MDDNQSIRSRAKEYLEQIGQAPKMYATTCEAFLCSVTSIVWVITDFDQEAFWFRHLPASRRYWPDVLQKDFTDEWARNVVDDALQLI